MISDEMNIIGPLDEAFAWVASASLTPDVTGTYKFCDQLLVVMQLFFDHMITLLKSAGTDCYTLFWDITCTRCQNCCERNEGIFHLNEM